MRILQARFVGLAMMSVAALFLGVSPGIAQKGAPAGGGSTAPSPGKGTPSPSPTPTPGQLPTTQGQTPANTPQVPRPIWVSGKVMMYDGGAPPESVTIELVCSANSVKPEGYTDSHGSFSFNLGQNNGVFADASTDDFSDVGLPGLSSSPNNGFGGNIGGTTNVNPDAAYWDCELRARLPGYRSDTVSLAGRRMLDTPDVGVILLYPISKIQGLTASATSAQAPKDARKAYEKGVKALKKNKTDEAEQDFRKAVQIYPRHAEAWLALGKILEKSGA